MAKRIKYALNSNGAETTYANVVSRPGAKGPWSESEDNPMSNHFIPPGERGQMGQARFWAMAAKRRKQVIKSGQFDP